MKLDDKIDLSVGLHTCGPLSKVQFDHSISHQIPQILNFGCCYYMMDSNSFNISKAAKQNPFNLYLESLSLANRAHGSTSNALNGFSQKLKVKRYRYAFQFLYEKITGKNDDF